MAKMFGLCKITLDTTKQIWYNTNMIVYRIQSKQNRTRGAYSTHPNQSYHKIVNNMAEQHRECSQHPSPAFDAGIGFHSFDCTQYCGFDSAASLLRWFKGFIPDLLRAGYEIVALHDVTITAVGKYQVLFKWND